MQAKHGGNGKSHASSNSEAFHEDGVRWERSGGCSCDVSLASGARWAPGPVFRRGPFRVTALNRVVLGEERLSSDAAGCGKEKPSVFLRAPGGVVPAVTPEPGLRVIFPFLLSLAPPA